ncbi:MAG: hypothetical protein KH324_11915, partial [Ruminococcus sp.]|nr:hypothetical protein [Ruminococcus sp.]
KRCAEEKPSGGRGMPFFALALVSSSPWWCLLCIRYGLYKNEKCNLSVPAPYGGKQKCYFFKIALSFKPPAIKSFWRI